MTDSKKPRAGFFFGWVVVATAFLVGMLTGGLHAYTRGIFLKPVAADLDASRTDLSIGFVITAVVSALVSPLIGHLLDRYSLKKIMLFAVLWTALGYLAFASVQGRWQLFIVLGLFFGVATFSFNGLSIPKLILNWFNRRRGLALAIAAMGASSAGIVAPPVATYLIDNLGWRGTLFCFSALTILVVLPLVVFLKEQPADLGLYPDNQPPERLPEDNTIENPLDTALIHRREFLTNRSFWGLVLIFGMQGCMFRGISVHLFPHLTDIGFDQQRTALALSLLAAFAMLSKPMFGWMLDRWPPWVSITTSVASETVAVLLFLVSRDYVIMLMAAVLFGFGFGATNPLRNGIAALIFGGRNFGSVAGTLQPMMLPLTIIGLPLGGWIYDTFQNYDLMFQIFIAFYLISLLGLIPIRGAGR